MISDLDLFHAQMAIWGTAVSGSPERSAEVAEYQSSWYEPMWDQPEVLKDTRVNGERPPDWYALHWVTEHVRRGLAFLPE